MYVGYVYLCKFCLHECISYLYSCICVYVWVGICMCVHVFVSVFVIVCVDLFETQVINTIMTIAYMFVAFSSVLLVLSGLPVVTIVSFKASFKQCTLDTENEVFL